MKTSKPRRQPDPNTLIDRKAVLSKLASSAPLKLLSEAEEVVTKYRSLIRRAIRAGHSLQALATELKLPKRTLQRHLTKAGLFFRKPRVNKGTVIRPYKARKK
jgi:ribosome-binding protein aMBF1 (putative translation factor)